MFFLVLGSGLEGAFFYFEDLNNFQLRRLDQVGATPLVRVVQATPLSARLFEFQLMLLTNANTLRVLDTQLSVPLEIELDTGFRGLISLQKPLNYIVFYQNNSFTFDHPPLAHRGILPEASPSERSILTQIALNSTCFIHVTRHSSSLSYEIVDTESGEITNVTAKFTCLYEAALISPREKSTLFGLTSDGRFCYCKYTSIYNTFQLGSCSEKISDYSSSEK